MKYSLILAAPLLLLPYLAHSQTLVSADDLVQMLKPKAGGATRGIRALNEPSATPAPAPAATMPHAAVAPGATVAMARPVAPAPAATSGQSSVNLTVQFENGSDRLTPAATRTLDELGRALASPTLSSYNFRIIGHTDSVGSKDTNQLLSERRATAVTAYITSHYGVQAARLTAQGVGQSDPLVSAPEGTPEPRNRRVQIINASS